MLLIFCPEDVSSRRHLTFLATNLAHFFLQDILFSKLFLLCIVCFLFSKVCPHHTQLCCTVLCCAPLFAPPFSGSWVPCKVANSSPAFCSVQRSHRCYPASDSWSDKLVSQDGQLSWSARLTSQVGQQGWSIWPTDELGQLGRSAEFGQFS